ncbi:D-alanyl-D-alanine carboxypeptidase/D-alanyl-D-alanine-endopeptidase, partial [candidate division WOR-3 bacterium]|nr:D-alanyl-D-alanine carboxypeptidase/D-alanyl-D-alanine-endopeptidase [candidate division WOR-3 bacterium]
EFVEFVNLLVPGSENRYTVERYFENGKNIIIFSGSLKNPIERTVNLERPDLFTGYLLKNEILKNGISFSGTTTNILTLPALYETLCVNFSQPLHSLTDSILTYSLNLASELLLRKIASLVTPGASSLDGVSYILQRLSEMGLSSSGIVAKDGCGLSRYNLMTPKFLTSLLRFMLRQPSVSVHFFNSLPLMGKEGTVSNRLRRISGDKIRAKTGTLTGISSIAGYIVTESRDTLCFSILMNNFTISQNQIKNIQDSIILELTHY